MRVFGPPRPFSAALGGPAWSKKCVRAPRQGRGAVRPARGRRGRARRRKRFGDRIGGQARPSGVHGGPPASPAAPPAARTCPKWAQSGPKVAQSGHFSPRAAARGGGSGRTKTGAPACPDPARHTRKRGSMATRALARWRIHCTHFFLLKSWLCLCWPTVHSSIRYMEKNSILSQKRPFLVDKQQVSPVYP